MFELTLTIVYRLEGNNKSCQSLVELGTFYASLLTIFPRKEFLRNVLLG